MWLSQKAVCTEFTGLQNGLCGKTRNTRKTFAKPALKSGMCLYTNPLKTTNVSEFRTRSFASDVLLHQLTYSDIFWLSASKNLLMYQLPSVLMYRAMKCTWSQIVQFMVFNAMMKTTIDVFLYLNS